MQSLKYILKFLATKLNHPFQYASFLCLLWGWNLTYRPTTNRAEVPFSLNITKVTMSITRARDIAHFAVSFGYEFWILSLISWISTSNLGIEFLAISWHIGLMCLLFTLHSQVAFISCLYSSWSSKEYSSYWLFFIV